MQHIRSITQMIAVRNRARRRGRSIGFVPTMGALHEGHLSLIRRARRESDLVVVSIFVNPKQFGPREDYRRYPRKLKRDAALAREAGCDVLFVPSVAAMYPAGFETVVEVPELSATMCGLSRPGHFRGVATVVTKLLHIVAPNVAYFGQKDAQQALIIKKLARDLNFDARIKVVPIVREPDGLAMSSRNQYLSPAQRREATAIFESLQTARRLMRRGERRVGRVRGAVRRRLASAPRAQVEYVAVVEPETLRPLTRITGKALVALAVWIGHTRLIDNITV